MQYFDFCKPDDETTDNSRHGSLRVTWFTRRYMKPSSHTQKLEDLKITRELYTPKCMFFSAHDTGVKRTG